MTEHPATQPPAWIRIIQRHWGWVMVMAVLAMVATVRIRLLDLPLERDEGEYAYAGQLILEGIPPYQLAYNMKFPGTYVAYALIMGVFGQTPAGIHLGVTCVTTLTALLLYWFGRRLLDETTGVVAATAFALLSASPALLGLAGHATHFAALFATTGLCLLWPARQTAHWLRAGAGGLMLGLAVLMKQHAIFFCLWGFLFLGVGILRERQAARDRKARSMISFCAGMLLPFALTCVMLWRAGVFERFWFWTFSYAREYVTVVPLAQVPALFWDGVSNVLSSGSLIWLVAAAGVGLVWFDDRLRGKQLPMVGLVLAAFLTTCPGFFFRRHYFLLMLPAAALLAGCGVSTACHLWRRRTSRSWFNAWPVWICLLALGLVIVENRSVWFFQTPAQASHTVYPSHPFVEAEDVSEFIRTNSTPGTRVAVLGSEPEIYFLSRRHSATGYIYTYPLMEPQPYAGPMQREMIREIESAKPAYVVLVIAASSWLPKVGSKRLLSDWWEQSYQTNYTVVGIADLAVEKEPRFVWGREAEGRGLPPNGGVVIYRRQGAVR